MMQISADILALSGEAFILIKYGKVFFANNAACDLLGQDCVGKTLKKLFGDEIAGIQAGFFTASTTLNETELILRVVTCDGVKAMSLSKTAESAIQISDAFVFSLRSCQMTLGTALENARSKAQSIGDPELMGDIASITHEYFKINRVISNVSVIRDYANSSLFYRMQNFDLSEMLRKNVSSLKLIFDSPEIRFHAPEHLYISADPNLISILFSNLVSNALIHAHGRSRISISLLESNDQVILSVDDDGCGISGRELYHVFDRYRHIDSLSGISMGAGFGMTAVRDIARLHGGTVLLESRENAGTAVRVSLSRSSSGINTLHEPEAAYENEAPQLLTGFATCLPDRFYSEKYVE